jgi:hypothetical protein
MGVLEIRSQTSEMPKGIRLDQMVQHTCCEVEERLDLDTGLTFNQYV